MSPDTIHTHLKDNDGTWLNCLTPNGIFKIDWDILDKQYLYLAITFKTVKVSA